MSEINVIEVKTQIVLGTRKRGKYELIATLLPQLYQYATEKVIQIQGSPVFVCHEKSIEEVEKAQKEENADIEVAFPIAKKVDGKSEIKCYELPGGKMAKIIHKGKYQDCAPTYEKLYKWIKEKGKTITGPTREVYLNDPCEVAEEELITEIYAPIE